MSNIPRTYRISKEDDKLIKKIAKNLSSKERLKVSESEVISRAVAGFEVLLNKK